MLRLFFKFKGWGEMISSRSPGWRPMRTWNISDHVNSIRLDIGMSLFLFAFSAVLKG